MTAYLNERKHPEIFRFTRSYDTGIDLDQLMRVSDILLTALGRSALRLSARPGPSQRLAGDAKGGLTKRTGRGLWHLHAKPSFQKASRATSSRYAPLPDHRPSRIRAGSTTSETPDLVYATIPLRVDWNRNAVEFSSPSKFRGESKTRLDRSRPGIGKRPSLHLD